MFTGSLSDGSVTVPIHDARIERQNLAEQSTPIASQLSKHVNLMLSRCNSFAMPLHEPSHAWILVSRGDLDGLDLNARMRLTFQSDSPTNTTIIWRNLIVCREPQVLIPGNVADDPDGVVLVELSDPRWLVYNPYFQVSISEIYNVRAPAYQGASGATTYLATSLNAGVAWTWDEMAEDVWGAMSSQLGTYPGLPFTPDGTPEGWAFSGVPAWEALTSVLRRIGCAVTADLTQTTGPYTIVRIGATDAAADAAIAAAVIANRKIHDAEFQTAVKGVIPYGVEVFFQRRELYGSNEKATRRDSSSWYGNAVYSVQVAGPEITVAEAGVYHPIQDDLPAIYDHSGTLTNSAALATRSQERADDFYRMLRGSGGKRRWLAFSGLLVVSPGSTLKGVAWACHGSDGVYTELVNHPFLMMGLDAKGDWCERDYGGNVNAPTAGPNVLRAQVVKIANGTPSGVYYDATVEVRDNAGVAWASQESVYAIDLAGASSLTTGHRYDAVHVGYENTRPLYAIRSATGGGSGITSINGQTGPAVTLQSSGATVTITEPSANVVDFAIDTPFVIGTGALVDSAATISGTGTYAPIVYGGALVDSRATLTGAGTCTPPTFTGTGALVTTPVTLSGAGAYSAFELFVAEMTAPIMDVSSGRWVYAWVEQDINPANGDYQDMVGGRSGDTSTGPFMRERNDALVLTPLYSLVRQRGNFGGQRLYDFEHCCSTGVVVANGCEDTSGSLIDTADLLSGTGTITPVGSVGDGELVAGIDTLSGTGTISIIGFVGVGALVAGIDLLAGVGTSFTDTEYTGEGGIAIGGTYETMADIPTQGGIAIGGVYT